MNAGVHPVTMTMVVTGGVSMSPGIAVPLSDLSLRRDHGYSYRYCDTACGWSCPVPHSTSSLSLALRQQTLHQLKDVAPYLVLLNLLTQPLESRK